MKLWQSWCAAACVAASFAAASAQQPMVYRNANNDARPPMPANVWAMLRSDPDVQQRLAASNLSGSYPPSSWFETIPVKLRLTGTDGMIVVESNAAGAASAGTYWVVLDVFTAPRIALRVQARDLQVEDRYSYGYRQLRAWSAGDGNAYTTTFRYDGQNYQPVRAGNRGAN